SFYYLSLRSSLSPLSLHDALPISAIGMKWRTCSGTACSPEFSPSGRSFSTCSCTILTHSARTPIRHCLACTSKAARASLSRSSRSEEHTSELQSLTNLLCRLLLEK